MRTALLIPFLLLSRLALAQGAPSSQPGSSSLEEGSTFAPGLPPTTKIEAPSASAEGLVTAFEAYEQWLRRFDSRFTSIEERIARASQTLDTLEFEVIGDVGAPANAAVSHGVEPGPYFSLEELRYSLDGVPIASRIVPSTKDASDRVDVFAGRIVPGMHLLTVELIFRVRGFELAVGELRSARLRAKGTYRFEAKEGVTSTIEVTGKDTSSKKPTGLSAAQVEKRFAVTFALREAKNTSPAAPEPSPTPASSTVTAAPKP